MNPLSKNNFRAQSSLEGSSASGSFLPNRLSVKTRQEQPIRGDLETLARSAFNSRKGSIWTYSSNGRARVVARRCAFESRYEKIQNAVLARMDRFKSEARKLAQGVMSLSIVFAERCAKSAPILC